MEKKPDFWTLIGIRCALIGVLFALYASAYILMARPGNPQDADIHKDVQKDGMIVTTRFPAYYPAWALYPLEPGPVFAPLNAIDRQLRPGIWRRVEHRPAPTPFGRDNRSTFARVDLRRVRDFAIDDGDAEMQARVEDALAELETGPAKAERRLLAAFVETEPDRTGGRRAFLVFFDDEDSPIPLHFMNATGHAIGSAEVAAPVIKILDHPFRWMYLDIKVVEDRGKTPLSIIAGESRNEYVALVGEPETIVCGSGDAEPIRVSRVEKWPPKWLRSP